MSRDVINALVAVIPLCIASVIIMNTWSRKLGIVVLLIGLFGMNLVSMVPEDQITYNIDNKRTVQEAPKAKNA